MFNTTNRPCFPIIIAHQTQPLAKPSDLGVRLKAETWRTGSNGLGNVGRGQMTIVFFNHARVAMAEILRHDKQRDARHRS